MKLARKPVGKPNTSTHRIRIIGGQWKRTPLAVADVSGLRPTPDRVRETVFNWLAHLRPDVASLRGLDLFAGTGALGFELASRGAARVVLVERDATLATQLRATQQKLNATHIEILVGDAFSVAQRLPEAAFDVVFLDPPYDTSRLRQALTTVRRLLAPEGLVYAEDAAALSAAHAESLSYALLRAGRAGAVHFHLLAKSAEATCAP